MVGNIYKSTLKAEIQNSRTIDSKDLFGFDIN